MPCLKKMEVRDLSSKYGCQHRGVVALEPIRRGEMVFACNPSMCNYYPADDTRACRTRAEVLALMDAHPEAKDFIRFYTYMVDDDLFNVPRNYDTQGIIEECVFFNHSCDPNCGYTSDHEFAMVAIRNIDIGEELTFHYGFMDTEESFLNGLLCKCGAKNCVGELKFNFWRDKEWQKQYEQYASDYIRQKIRKLHEEQAKKA